MLGVPMWWVIFFVQWLLKHPGMTSWSVLFLQLYLGQTSCWMNQIRLWSWLGTCQLMLASTCCCMPRMMAWLPWGKQGWSTNVNNDCIVNWVQLLVNLDRCRKVSRVLNLTMRVLWMPLERVTSPNVALSVGNVMKRVSVELAWPTLLVSNVERKVTLVPTVRWNHLRVPMESRPRILERVLVRLRRTESHLQRVPERERKERCLKSLKVMESRMVTKLLVVQIRLPWFLLDLARWSVRLRSWKLLRWILHSSIFRTLFVMISFSNQNLKQYWQWVFGITGFHGNLWELLERFLQFSCMSSHVSCFVAVFRWFSGMLQSIGSSCVAVVL